MKPLEGKVAVVAGATRGCGRGIAVALGEAGATVYGTGRSTRGNPSPMRRPETIEETAERVSAAGGRGIAVRVDHTVASEVEALFARVRREQGRLDILVNDVWGGDDLAEWGKPFWEQSLEKGLLMLTQAVHSHVITSRFGVPLMIEGGAGLVVEVTDGDSPRYRGNFFYDLVKASVIRLAVGMAGDFAERNLDGLTAVAITPGFLRSEYMLDHFGVREENWRDAVAKDPHFAESETPALIGRTVAALAADPRAHERAGHVLASWNLALEYGIVDADGRRPDWGAYAKRTFGW